MNIIRYYLSIAIILLMAISPAYSASGGLDVNIGYRYMDDDGDLSLNQPTFNDYDGIGLSVERINYMFDNGLRLRSNLRNINLDSRNLSADFGKPGLFNIDVRSNKFRRIYNADGSNNTKRDLTHAGLWVRPIKYVKLFANGDFNAVSGRMEDLFSTSFGVLAHEIDYTRNKYSFGANVKYQRSMIQGEYGTSDFNDNANAGKDQTRKHIRLLALTNVPKYEWLILSGAYQRFENEYDNTGFMLKSYSFRGSLLAQLTPNLSANYIAFFNRAGSDSDFVETDNLAHNIYLTYVISHRAGLTLGYQNHVKDDYDRSVKANSFYVEGWGSPVAKLDLKAAYGFRAEDVDEGQRLVGDEDRSRMSFSAKYRLNNAGSIKAAYEDKHRKNDQLDSEADYYSMSLEAAYDLPRYASVAAGYTYSSGDYTNTEQRFEFINHQLHVGINSHEYKHAACGAMLIYYRSLHGLNTEGSDLRFSGTYNFGGGNRFEIVYNVFNFDDFLYRDHYYTGNIVEINLIKSFKF